MPWLLAIVTASTPARLRTPKAAAGARNVNSFGCAVPRSVTAVSRLTTARSARRSTPKAEPTRPPPSEAPAVPSKWMSPAKASVTDPPPDVRAAGAVGVAAVRPVAGADAVPVVADRGVGEGRTALASFARPVPHAVSASTAATATSAQRRTVTGEDFTRALWASSAHSGNTGQ